jgi:hypothetical protein
MSAACPPQPELKASVDAEPMEEDAPNAAASRSRGRREPAVVVADLLPAAPSPSVPVDGAAHVLPAGRSRREGARDVRYPPLPLPPSLASMTPSTAAEQGRGRGLRQHPVVVVIVRARRRTRRRRPLRHADLAREGGRRRGCPSSIAGAQGRAAEEQRMGAAEEQRNGKEWRKEGEIGVGSWGE